MGRKPKIQTRVEHDTKDALDAYVEDHPEVSQSEAVRHVIRAGLASKGYPVAMTDGGTPLERIASERTLGYGLILELGSLILWIAALYTTGQLQLALFFGGCIFLVFAATIVAAAAIAQVALARPLRYLVFGPTEDTA